MAGAPARLPDNAVSVGHAEPGPELRQLDLPVDGTAPVADMALDLAVELRAQRQQGRPIGRGAGQARGPSTRSPRGRLPAGTARRWPGRCRRSDRQRGAAPRHAQHAGDDRHHGAASRHGSRCRSSGESLPSPAARVIGSVFRGTIRSGGNGRGVHVPWATPWLGRRQLLYFFIRFRRRGFREGGHAGIAQASAPRLVTARRDRKAAPKGPPLSKWARFPGVPGKVPRRPQEGRTGRTVFGPS